jgi:lipopolysaccharide export system permease protein
LGTPRTTRQSRAVSLMGAIAVVAVVRGLGFIGTISGSQSPLALAVPYVGLAAAFLLGAWAIGRGAAIEPPALFTNLANTITEAVKRRTAITAGQHS